jgi:methylenetetrahydrofolate reductase (NADPH)
MSFLSVFSTKPVVSLEVFPPKPDAPFDALDDTLRELRPLAPAFVSVTYGAGGSRAAHTADIAGRIPRLCGCPALGHLTCVGADDASVKETLQSFVDQGVEAVLALRGDLPEGMDDTAAFTHFRYACELVRLIRETHPTLAVGAACYPEGHYQSPSLTADLDNLKYKVDCGADFLVTQLFFDNNAFYAFVDRARRAGITVPILAGVMPVLNAQQIFRMTTLGGSSVPAALSRLFARYANDPRAFRQAGLDFCCAQILDLKLSGVDGFHLYTMNRPKTAARILARTGLREIPAQK